MGTAGPEQKAAAVRLSAVETRLHCAETIIEMQTERIADLKGQVDRMMCVVENICGIVCKPEPALAETAKTLRLVK